MFGESYGSSKPSCLAATKLSMGPPHQMSNCGLSFSLRRRVSDSPLDIRTKLTVMSG